MSDKSGRLYGFLKELKRRHVLRSLAIYAGTAFVILEAATIIFPRLGFPDPHGRTETAFTLALCF